MKQLFLLVAIVLLPTMAEAQDYVQTIEIASFETRYGDYGRYRGRAHNIRRTAELLAMIRIQPGEQFSFNTSVGERTRERGFRQAPVIASGRMDRDYGGGVCQTASTIYAAALYAGLNIVEQHPHSRISSYIRPGLDATVDWSTSKDLVIENPYSFPVTMTVITYEGRREAEEIVRVVFSAPVEVPEVSIRLYRRQLSSFNTVEEIDPTLDPGARRTVEPGTPRVYVVMRRTFETLDGFPERSRETRRLTYESSDRIVLVGPTD